MQISKTGKNLIRPLKVHLLQLVSFKVFMGSQAFFVFCFFICKKLILIFRPLSMAYHSKRRENLQSSQKLHSGQLKNNSVTR